MLLAVAFERGKVPGPRHASPDPAPFLGQGICNSLGQLADVGAGVSVFELLRRPEFTQLLHYHGFGP